MSTSQSVPLVLYADSDQPLSDQIKRIFEREGFGVHCVVDGNDVLAAARRLSPAVIVLNTDLPPAGGLEVLRRLRAAEDLANIPAIVTSSQPRRPADMDPGPGLEADDWLNKPFSPKELLARARSKMHAGQLHAELQRRTRELEALLHASEQLNRVKSVNDLLEMMPQLTLDLLPGSLVALGRLDEAGVLRSHRVFNLDDRPLAEADRASFLKLLQGERQSRLLNDVPELPDAWTGCMIAVVHHGTDVQANTLVASTDERYHAHELQLLEGIGQQAVLALDDAQLHELMARQNRELEETVRERSADLESARNMMIRSEKLVTIGHLAAGLAHEINNPLQPIRILLDDMLEDLRAGEVPDPGDVLRIQESIDRITRTVGQVLGFTRRDGEDSVFTRLDLTEVLAAVVQLNRKLFEQEGVHLKMEVPSLPAICGNRDQLEQVFMNLFLNALAAMSAGDTLTLVARLHADHVEVLVRDTGHGIAPEHLKGIFEPYFTTRKEGRGLGLFISYSIVQMHRGSIEVESAPGQGATFVVKLPLADSTPCEQVTQPAAFHEA